MLTKRLMGLKTRQLQHAAFLLGLPSSGTKAQISKTLENQLYSPIPPPKEPNRIVSIDMGLKNLGICVLEPLPNPPSSPLRVKIIDWKRLNLLSHPSSPTNPSNQIPTPEAVIEKFSPSILSQLAVNIANALLTTYKPSTILLERQRFRSGGASAVQEWTLRVNMFESMLWAVLATLRCEGLDSEKPKLEHFPLAEEVLPARVAAFWCNAPTRFAVTVPGNLFDMGKFPAAEGKSQTKSVEASEAAEEAKEAGWKATQSKRSIDKKEKIALVRSWLSPDNPPTMEKSPLNRDAVHLELSETSQLAADELLQKKGDRPAKKIPARKEVKEKQKGNVKKLDDLADCLLQGVAWLQWRENERVVKDMLSKEGLMDPVFSNA